MKNHTIVFRDRSGSMHGLLEQADTIADVFLHFPGRVELWDGVEAVDSPHRQARLIAANAAPVPDDTAFGPWPQTKFNQAYKFMMASPARRRRFVLITDESAQIIGISFRSCDQIAEMERDGVEVIVIEVKP